MTALVAFIAAYLGAALFVIAGGVPFTPTVVLWINFLVQVPIAIALGFDKPAAGLMERKPRPLSQPVLSRSQWVRIVFIGLLMAIGTLVLEAAAEPAGAVMVATMGFVVFSLFNIVDRPELPQRNRQRVQPGYPQRSAPVDAFRAGAAAHLPPGGVGLLQRFLGLTQLSGNQWLLCIVFAFALLLVDEVIKFFMRRRRSKAEPSVAVPAPAQA